MNTTSRFRTEQIHMTTVALATLTEQGENPVPYFARHFSGDWGDLGSEDKQANEEALKHGDRLLSAYHLASGTKIYIITEWDRSLTTLLLKEEY